MFVSREGLKISGFHGSLMSIVSLLLACGTVFDTTVADEPIPPSTYRQKHFAIGAFWPIFPDNADLDLRLREMAEANFNLVFGPIAGCSPAQLVELCEKNELSVITYALGNGSQLPTGDACWGYRLWDEPATTQFPELRQRAIDIRKRRPGMLDYINLYPNYASEKQLGINPNKGRRAKRAGYDEYVRRFVEQLEPAVLCYDNYPIFKPGPGGLSPRSKIHLDLYIENLDTVRKHALQQKIPFWNYFNAVPYGPHTDPTEGQQRWQIYSSLAYGAKGVLYFTYGTPDTFEFPRGGGLLDRSGRRTNNWYEAQEINASLKHLGPTLMQLTSEAVFRIRPGDDTANLLTGTPIRRIYPADVFGGDPPNDYLVGVFRHRDGRRAVLLTNYRFAFGAWPTVEFNAPAKSILEVDQRTGHEVPALDENPAMEGFQIGLKSGAGRLFLLPSGK
jgi:hypothetical protein